MIISILVLIGFFILLGLYNGLLLKDDKIPENDPSNKQTEKMWHLTGAALFCYISIVAWYYFNWKYALFSLSGFWLVFGSIVHKVGLNKPFFYVGTTASTDKLIRRISSKSPELVSGILKTSFFLLSLLLILL